jgi:hypothetical protein
MAGKAQHMTLRLSHAIYTDKNIQTIPMGSKALSTHSKLSIEVDREKNWLDRKQPLSMHTDRETEVHADVEENETPRS